MIERFRTGTLSWRPSCTRAQRLGFRTDKISEIIAKALAHGLLLARIGPSRMAALGLLTALNRTSR